MLAVSPGYASVSDLAFRGDKGEHWAEQVSLGGTEVAHLAWLLDASYNSTQEGSTHNHPAYSSMPTIPLTHQVPNKAPSLACLLITLHANGPEAGYVLDAFLMFQTCKRCRASSASQAAHAHTLWSAHSEEDTVDSTVAHLQVSSFVYRSSYVHSLLRSTCTRASGQSFLPPSASESMRVPPSPISQSQPPTYKFISSPFNLLLLNNNIRLHTKTEPLLQHSTTSLTTLYHSKHPPCAPALPPPCFPSLSPLRRSPSWPPSPWLLRRWSLRTTACVPTPRCRMLPRAV